MRGGVSSGSLSQEAISLQSGDLVPFDEPFSRSSEAYSQPSGSADSSGGRSMRFDFGGAAAPDSESRGELEFLPRSLEMDPSRPFGDALASPRMPLDLSLDSSDVISVPPSLEVAAAAPSPLPASARPPAVAAPIAWGRRERQAPVLVRGAGVVTPMPGRLAGRARNLAGPARPQRFTPPPPAPEPEQELQPEPLYAAPPAYEPPAYEEPAYQAPAYQAPAYEAATYEPPPAHAAPSPQSESYVPQPRQPLDAYKSGGQVAYSAYGTGQSGAHGAFDGNADADADAAPSGLPDYDEPAPVSELPDPRGYVSAPAAHGSAVDPYAPAPEWGAGFVPTHGKRPESSYREFARPGQGASAQGASGQGGSSEASFVGGKFIDESVQSSSPGARAAQPAAYDSMTGPRRDLVSPAAERSFVENGRGAPHFPAPPGAESTDPPSSSELPTSEAYAGGGGGAYDSGISQQFQSLPILPTASELLAAAAGRGQPVQLGAPPPAPLPLTASQVVPAAAPRSRMLLLAYSVVLGGVGMVALVHFGSGAADAPARVAPPAVTSQQSVPPAVAPPPAPYYGQPGVAQPGVIGMQPGAVPPGYVPQGYPQPGYPGQAYPGQPYPGQAYSGYPGGPQPVYATPSEVAPPPEEATAKPKPKPAGQKPAAASKPAAPATPKPPKDDEKPPATSDSKPAKDSSGKASSDLFDNAL